MGLIMGINNMIELFNEKYYRDLNGGILEAFGILFTRDLKVYLYPSKLDGNEEILTSKNMPVHPRLRPLYDYLINNGRIVDLEGFDAEVLNIQSREVLQRIRSGQPGWEKMVPNYVDVMIKNNRLFGYDPDMFEEEPASDQTVSGKEKSPKS